MDIYLKRALTGIGAMLLGIFVYLDTEIDEVRYIVMDMPRMAPSVSWFRIPAFILIVVGALLLFGSVWLGRKKAD